MIPAPSEQRPTLVAPCSHLDIRALTATPVYTPQSRDLLALPAWLVRESQRWPAMAALLLATAALGLFSLLRSPAPFVDEAWYAARAWALIQTGRAFGTLDAGVLERFDGYWTFFPWLGTWFHALAIRLLGLSLFSVRLTSLAFGLVLLTAIYAIGKQLCGPRVGLLAALLVSLSSPFVYSSHLARQDIMVAALGYSAIALCLADRGSGFPIRSILSGLAVGLAFEIHPNGCIYGPTIVALHLFDDRWAALRSKRLWGFVAGLGGGLAFYAAMHILPYPQTYAALTRLTFSSTHTPPLLVSDPSVWLGSLVDTGLFCLVFGSVRMPLVLAAFVSLWRTRSAANRKLAVLCTALLLAFLALIRNKLPYYAVHLSPAADLLLAAFLTRLFRPGWSGRCWASRRAMVALGLVVPSMAFSLTPMLDSPMDEYQTVVARVTESVDPDNVLMGSQTYWFGLREQPYLSWQQLVYYRGANPESSLEDGLLALHPDVLIIDEHVEQFIVDDNVRLPNYFQFFALSKPSLEDFLAKKAQLVITIPTQAFGNVKVYRIEWQRASSSASTPAQLGRVTR